MDVNYKREFHASSAFQVAGVRLFTTMPTSFQSFVALAGGFTDFITHRLSYVALSEDILKIHLLTSSEGFQAIKSSEQNLAFTAGAIFGGSQVKKLAPGPFLASSFPEST